MAVPKQRRSKSKILTRRYKWYKIAEQYKNEIKIKELMSLLNIDKNINKINSKKWNSLVNKIGKYLMHKI